MLSTVGVTNFHVKKAVKSARSSVGLIIS